ncbi:MAG: UDP-glucose/GDP-mannose dehydrogenase family protein [Candidatus Rokubacteria bacterium]|nr:UDP-glucose/GDP-mannose dehydrogenase family protein [Candidatus Rokubacteria bacterium]
MARPIVVLGLWHLGPTIAACLAAEGFRVVGTDPDPNLVAELAQGRVPVAEPGLAELVQAELASGRLSFQPDPATALAEANLMWVAFDTPVDDEDEADVGFVRRETARLIRLLPEGATVAVSSQVPVGFTRGLREWWVSTGPPRRLRFAYSPENLRIGTALQSFRQPARTVIGTEDGTPNQSVRAALAPFARELLWMSIESAEFTKHALNAFLATSVAFINEIARLCERYGADAKEVERALKSDPRIGPGAYLSPGPAFAGGTLARDVRFLRRLGDETGVRTLLLAGVLESNAEQDEWRRRKIEELVGHLAGARIGVLGLTYKPGTDTLRRSAALALCAWLAERGALVRAHDPAVRLLPSGFVPRIELVPSPADVLPGADLLVVATPWPEYRRVAADDLVAAMKAPRVVDESRLLADTLGADPRIQYVTVGVPPAGSRGRS